MSAIHSPIGGIDPERLIVLRGTVWLARLTQLLEAALDVQIIIAVV